MKDSLYCCVCLKDDPFENNPIISCDGKNCVTVVHKVCYGIQHIPDGAWFCQKCISLETTACVRCELCPSMEGALKHTNKGGWCHIVCALFVPGAEFLDIDRLEMVSLEKVSADRYNKICSICEKNNRLDRASVGACIKCLKSGCKIMFHVTCGQPLGLLTEIVSTKEGVRYVAYCFLHHKRAKRRHFSIRLSNNINCSNKYYKNRVQQSPPMLEKSNEDGPMSQEHLFNISGLNFTNPNISTYNSNINISPDSMSWNDRCAPEICSRSEYSTIEKDNIVTSKNKAIISEYVIHPTNKTTDASLLPPDICCLDQTVSFLKKEATVQSGLFSSTCSNSFGEQEILTVLSSKRRGAIATSHIPHKKERFLKTEEKCEPYSNPPESPIKLEKMNSLSNAIRKIKNRFGEKCVPPSLPKSIFSHMNDTISRALTETNSSMLTPPVVTSPKVHGTSFQSMEELLEWQWEKTGNLLLQQEETSDIASLLSCLHDLKSENEQLLSKQLKLSHRIDHLRATNAQLQFQLYRQPTESLSKADSNEPILNENLPLVSRPFSGTLQKVSPTEQQQQIQYDHMSLAGHQFSNGMVPCCPLTEGSSVFIQQSIPVWTQPSSDPSQPIVDQSINYQTHRKHQPQQLWMATSMTQSFSTAVSVSNPLSQTDLVALLNNQLHSELFSFNQNRSLVSCNQLTPTTQDINISKNNVTNLDFLYQSLLQKNQPQRFQSQSTLISNVFYHASKFSAQPEMGFSFDPTISQSSDNQAN